MISVRSAGLSDIGRHRARNEDALLRDDRRRLYIVADGMGGHQAGEIASGLVVETMSAFLQAPWDDPRPETGAGSATCLPPAQRLLQAIAAANQAVHQQAMENPCLRGMGSTVAAVLITPAEIIAANVGDSPIFRVAADGIEMLSISHNLAAEQWPGRSPLACCDNPLRHMLTRAVGIDTAVQPDCRQIPCRAGDVVVLASDGLSDKMDPAEIQALALDHTPQDACRRMIERANARGGEDNITAIVLALEL